jgi:DNA primase
VREHGAAAFEDFIAQAVPLSRQLIEAASVDCDLGTAEGRAHMLANARPLWSALPEGALKRQLLIELAATGRDDVDQLLRQWGHAPARPAARETAAPARPAPRRAGRVSKGAANLLDRAIWLLLHRCEAWAALDGESHDILAAQAAPYDLFFGSIERSLHEHGAMAKAALLDELRERAREVDGGAAVLTRIAAFHDPEPQTDLLQELASVVAKLRLREVEEELDLSAKSGLQTADARARYKELLALQSRLKARAAV